MVLSSRPALGLPWSWNYALRIVTGPLSWRSTPLSAWPRNELSTAAFRRCHRRMDQGAWPPNCHISYGCCYRAKLIIHPTDEHVGAFSDLVLVTLGEPKKHPNNCGGRHAIDCHVAPYQARTPATGARQEFAQSEEATRAYVCCIETAKPAWKYLTTKASIVGRESPNPELEAAPKGRAGPPTDGFWPRAL